MVPGCQRARQAQARRAAGTRPRDAPSAASRPAPRTPRTARVANAPEWRAPLRTPTRDYPVGQATI